jgi:chromosome segregation ATPase
MLAQELAPLEALIGQARQRKEALEGELRAIEAELETFSAERQRFDALRDICNALDKLGELNADELFWEGVAEHLSRGRSTDASTN